MTQHTPTHTHTRTYTHALTHPRTYRVKNLVLLPFRAGWYYLKLAMNRFRLWRYYQQAKKAHAMAKDPNPVRQLRREYQSMKQEFLPKRSRYQDDY